MNVSKYLGLLIASEELLSDALVTIADRHSQDPEIRDVAKMLAGWARSDMTALGGIVDRYGRVSSQAPARLRAALFHGARIGGLGLLRDLHDAALLAQHVHYCWLALYQAAQALQDDDLEDVCLDVGTHTDRTIAWLDTHIRALAPHALTVRSDAKSEVAASIPKTPTPDSLPDVGWAPVAGAVLVGIVGIASLVAGMPLLVASLGPTAFLMVEQPAHPTARAYNTIAGHAIGVAIGVACVAALDAWSQPTPLDGEVSALRVLASVIAVGVTLMATLLVRASHPPAAATALLVTLGLLQEMTAILSLAMGATLLAVIGAIARRARLGTWRARPIEAGDRTRPAADQPVY